MKLVVTEHRRRIGRGENKGAVAIDRRKHKVDPAL